MVANDKLKIGESHFQMLLVCEVRDSYISERRIILDFVMEGNMILKQSITVMYQILSGVFEKAQMGVDDVTCGNISINRIFFLSIL